MAAIRGTRRPGVDDFRQQLAAGVPRGSDGGALARHLGDVQSLKPEIAQVDMLSFRGSVTAAGVITQPSKLSTPQGYLAELFAIKAFMQNPGTDPELLPTIRFNLYDEGRTGSVFTSALEFAYFCDIQGGGNQTMWNRGLYVFDPGARVKCTFEVEGDSTLGYANLASETKYWGVALMLNLYVI